MTCPGLHNRKEDGTRLKTWVPLGPRHPVQGLSTASRLVLNLRKTYQGFEFIRSSLVYYLIKCDLLYTRSGRKWLCSQISFKYVDK